MVEPLYNLITIGDNFSCGDQVLGHVIFEHVGVSDPARAFRNLICRLIVDPKIFFSDFRAGVDTAFYIPSETSAKVCRAQIRKLYHDGFLNRENAQELLDVSDDPELFREKLNKHYILQWKPEEILFEEKLLPGGRKITLSEALKIPSIIKLSVISWISGRYRMIDVYYDLPSFDRESLVKEIKKYSNQPLKALKRLWVLSQLFDYQGDVIPKGFDLNQIVEDIEVLEELLKLPAIEIVKVKEGSQILDLKVSVKNKIKQLHPNDINNIYLEILSFEEDDLQSVFYSWLDWKESGHWKPESLREHLTKWTAKRLNREGLDSFQQAISDIILKIKPY